ncbi:MAG TPA: HlyD family efflux transporter periplasmic adaptor subunit [Thermoanaerobaculia bacterium]|jgi:HlyD family secretion protein|nr:HlyD family efflux transporter periplasmic adaptor subunit [Thermoanaerobaculia bacterium]
MDITRESKPRRKLHRGVAIGSGAAIILITTLGLARLKPAAPPLDRSTVVTDTVKRGPMAREVRGSGTLVPEDVRWIAATTDARVERVVVQAGAAVGKDTVILELSDPEQQQSVRDAEWQLRAAEAALESTRAQLETEKLDREASVARLRAEREQAALRADADAELERQGLVAHITKRVSQSSSDELGKRLELEEKRLRVGNAAEGSRLATQRAQVEQRRAMYELQQERTRSLQVRAGIDGVLQQVSVQAGQRLSAGTNIARVARADKLKAQIRVAETQAKDIAIGQQATIDTRNGVVKAHVTRIDPAVSDGTVLVDLVADEPLPAGARPDLSVDGDIELERIADTLSINRPVNAQEGRGATLFRVTKDGAERVKVDFGRASATAIEIRHGLKEGDEVVISDTSAFEKYERIKLQ